ncbi:MAG: hypothetical protein EAX96_05545 [Candidatus Lokiarchaeota archaeon]|nr:hypothetical protein [Candidatus Lokiarchaeota archaeon]
MDKDNKIIKIIPWIAFLVAAVSAYIEGTMVFIFQIYNPYANPSDPLYASVLGGQIAGALDFTLFDWIILQFVIELPIIIILTAYIIKLWKE